MTRDYQSPVDYRITQNPQSVKDGNSQQNFRDLYDFAFAVITTLVKYCGIGTLDPAIWNTIRPGDTLFTGNLNKLYCPANVAITSGQYISLVQIGGVLQAIVASSAVGTIAQADGYASANYAAGDTGEFILINGNNFHLSGLIIGQRYWLGSVGNPRTTPANTAGRLEQYLGIAVSTTALFTGIQYPIQH